MNRLFIFSFALVLISLTGCASRKEPDTLESAMLKQDDWLQGKVEKSKRRGASWDQRWENYSKKQDAKYYKWRDKMLKDN